MLLRRLRMGKNNNSSLINELQEKLKLAQEEGRIIFDSIPAWIFYKDRENRFVRVNKTFAEAMGLSQEELKGKSLFDLYPREQAEAFWKDDQEVIISAKSKTGIVESISVAGAARWVETSKIPYKDGRGNIVGVIGFSIDITDIVDAEDSLKRIMGKLADAEVKFSTIFNDSRDGILLSDIETGKLSLCNKMMCNLLGYSEEELLQLSTSDIHPQEKLAQVREIFARQAHGELQLAKELPVKRKDGSIFYADVNSSPISVMGKKYLMGSFRDVTERQKAREALEKANKDLMKLDELKTNFVSAVSHELRTPLSITRESISQVLDGIQGEINEKQRKTLDTSINNMDRLARIIDNLLDISKIEAGKIGLKVQEVDIIDLIGQVSKSFMPKIKEKGLELRLNLPQRTNKVLLDYDRILQVFTNLLANSLKFTKEGFIEIKAFEREGEIECSVSDSGIGISAEDLPKVFGKFQQFGHIERIGEKGTGLGLSIVKGIIDLHKGKIWVESELAKGSKFTFTLPRNTG